MPGGWVALEEWKLRLEPSPSLAGVGVEAELGKKNQNTSLAAKGALANGLQRRTACKIQNGRQWAPKWPTGLPLGFWAF